MGCRVHNQRLLSHVTFGVLELVELYYVIQLRFGFDFINASTCKIQVPQFFFSFTKSLSGGCK